MMNDQNDLFVGTYRGTCRCNPFVSIICTTYYRLLHLENTNIIISFFTSSSLLVVNL